MPITERTLKRWRKEALKEVDSLEGWDNPVEGTVERRGMAKRILRMTQELLDQHLLRKK